MNPKIKELVKTAVLAVDGCTGDEVKDEELSRMYIPDCFAEKFAELIVRECARIIDRGNGETCSSIAEEVWCNACRDYILYHFGLKPV
jgi:hypothetical protein